MAEERHSPGRTRWTSRSGVVIRRGLLPAANPAGPWQARVLAPNGSSCGPRLAALLLAFLIPLPLSRPGPRPDARA